MHATSQQLAAMIRTSKGLFLHVIFIKRGDGTERRMNCRYGPDHTLDNPPRDEKPGLIVVKDTTENKWKTLPIDGLRELHINGQIIEVSHD